MSAKILVIGSGGREHVLGWKLAASSLVKEVIIAPGNAGTSMYGSNVAKEVPIDNHMELAEWCKKNDINLVIIGSEVPLSNGICNVLTENGVKCFGPTKAAAEIESSKSFSKTFMTKYNIPTAKYDVFSTCDHALEYIDRCPHELVVKASGLAAGKGVVVCESKNEAKEAVKSIMEGKAHGKAGETVVVEERLFGEEISVLCFTDGVNVSVMPCSQDHKQLYEGDTGPNTGGMGAYCPVPQVSASTQEYIKEVILKKAIHGLAKENRKFKGVLYAGLILTDAGPKVLEFNCRFGDPETQVVIPLLKSDLYSIMLQCVNGDLQPESVKWETNKTALCIVLASLGYPGKYEKNKKISGIEIVKDKENVYVFEAGTKWHEGNKITNGGRVLAVTSVGTSLEECQSTALDRIQQIKFDKSYHRKDIGWKGIKHEKLCNGLTYSDSGVDVAAGNKFVKDISKLVKSTARSGSDAEIGGFGGVFDLIQAGYDNPVLVSGTDGVGTKLLIAQKCNNHSTIGIDLVAMCVNDIVTHNAEPLFFLDYFACGKLDNATALDVVKGISKGCKEAGCALIGGETAEMPGMYTDNHYDLAGFAVGAYDKLKHCPLPQISEICEDDIIIGLTSSGIHSNGFSLVRKVIEKQGLLYEDKAPFSNKTLSDSLLVPTAVYSKALIPILRKDKSGIKGMAHITGGGIWENIPRVLPSHLRSELDANNWEIPPVFGWLYKAGNIAAKEMLRTFNCGIGMALIVEKSKGTALLNSLKDSMKEINLDAFIIGKVSKRINEMSVVRNAKEAFEKAWESEDESTENGSAHEAQVKPNSKVAILISGSGTNMQSIIDKQNDKNYKVCLVISNKPSAKGLERANNAGVSTRTISHKNYKDQVDFDMEIDKVLMEHDIDIVCLAGFMRLLSKEFTEKWSGKLLNVHPSLLPAFKGMNAHEQVLKAGVRVTGCTVHFVTSGTDEGAIIIQAPVNVLPDDDEEILSERVKHAEHKLFPEAIQLLATKKIAFDSANNKTLWI